MGERQRQRDRQRHRDGGREKEREWETEADRQTDRQTDTESGRVKTAERDRDRDKQRAGSARLLLVNGHLNRFSYDTRFIPCDAAASVFVRRKGPGNRCVLPVGEVHKNGRTHARFTCDPQIHTPICLHHTSFVKGPAGDVSISSARLCLESTLDDMRTKTTPSSAFTGQ